MSTQKYIGHRLSKRSEKLMIALLLLGYELYKASYPNVNIYKYYIMRTHTNHLHSIFIHKHKAKYHAISSSKGCRISVTKIMPDTLKTLVALWES